MNKIVKIKIKEIKGQIRDFLQHGTSQRGAFEYLAFANDLTDEELDSEIRSQLKITYVGHSMGGMTLPIYVISSNLAGKPHQLS